MCSNTGSASSAGVSGSGGGDDNATHILKKPKRQRVPKRGPGVAELEKILREQENKVIHPDKGKPSSLMPKDFSLFLFFIRLLYIMINLFHNFCIFNRK